MSAVPEPLAALAEDYSLDDPEAVDALLAALQPTPALGSSLRDLGFRRRARISNGSATPLALAGLGLGILLLSPLRHQLEARSLSRQLDSYGPTEWQMADSIYAQIARLQTILGEAEALRARPPVALHVLTELATRLPHGTAVLRLVIEESGAQVTLLSDAGLGVVAALEEAPHFHDVRLMGDTRPTQAGSRVLQALTVAFVVSGAEEGAS